MWQRSILIAIAIIGLFILPNLALSTNLTVAINLTDVNGIGEQVGYITLEDTRYGLLITPNLSQLNPGIHGFHIHENPNCDSAKKESQIVPGLAAGGHYDPTKSESHQGPYQDGHLGDLPPLFVTQDGTATTPVLAPRLRKTDVMGHSVVVHLLGDNFSDYPKPLGGGGARLACGVI